MFSQFMGLPTCNRDKAREWQLLWFACMWTIWICRIFNNKGINISDEVEQIKFEAWTWLKAKVLGFCYSFSDWILSPLPCLGLSVRDCCRLRNFKQGPNVDKKKTRSKCIISWYAVYDR